MDIKSLKNSILEQSKSAYFTCKKCNFCGIRGQDNYTFTRLLCKTCHKLERKNYFYNNREKCYAACNKYKKKRRLIDLIYKKKEYARAVLYRKNRRKIDIIFKKRYEMATRLRKFLKSKNFTKKHSFSKYTGCTPEELMKHLESQFYDNMSWNNYGELWHIDHKIALMSAKTEDEIYQLCHYTNLQPLTIEDHKKKTLEDFKKAKG